MREARDVRGWPGTGPAPGRRCRHGRGSRTRCPTCRRRARRSAGPCGDGEAHRSPGSVRSAVPRGYRRRGAHPARPAPRAAPAMAARRYRRFGPQVGGGDRGPGCRPRPRGGRTPPAPARPDRLEARRSGQAQDVPETDAEGREPDGADHRAGARGPRAHTHVARPGTTGPRTARPGRSAARTRSSASGPRQAAAGTGTPRLTAHTVLRVGQASGRDLPRGLDAGGGRRRTWADADLLAEPGERPTSATRAAPGWTRRSTSATPHPRPWSPAESRPTWTTSARPS